MPTSLNISLPADLKRFVAARVRSGGYGSASEYLRELLREARRVEARRELEAQLLEGLASPVGRMTKGDWSAIRGRVRGARRGVS